VDDAVFAVAEEGGGILPFAVDAQDRRLVAKAGAMIGAGGMGQVVFDRDDLGFAEVEP